MRSWLLLASLFALQLLGCPRPAAAQTSDAVTTGPAPVLVARLDDVTINPVSARFILDQIAAAEKLGGVLILQLDTPGGLLQATRDIVKGLLGSRAPVVVYIAPSGSRAASAGMFVTLASHVAAMAPGTHIGAATPVGLGGDGRLGKRTGTTTETAVRDPEDDSGPFDGDAMSNKILNDTRAWVESIAERRGRNADWAREAVAQARSSSAEEARRLGVIDLVAEDLRDLLQQLDGRKVTLPGGESVALRTAGAIPTYVDMSLREQILNALASPSVSYILLLAGLALIFLEVSQPGGFLAGTVGAVCLLLAALGLQMLPTNYLALLLLAAGLGLIVAEVKVTSYGLLTVAGAVCLTIGSLILIDSPPGFDRIPKELIAVVVGTVTLIMAVLVAVAARTFRNRPAMGDESFVGETAEVLVPLEPEGKVFFRGTYWNAVSAVPIPKGQRVRVVRIHGLQLQVEPLEQKSTAAFEDG